MLVKRRNQFEAFQWDGSSDSLNGCAVSPGPGGNRIVASNKASFVINANDWVVFNALGHIAEILSNDDFTAQYEAGEEVDASWVATAVAASSIVVDSH